MPKKGSNKGSKKGPQKITKKGLKKKLKKLKRGFYIKQQMALKNSANLITVVGTRGGAIAPTPLMNLTCMPPQANRMSLQPNVSTHTNLFVSNVSHSYYPPPMTNEIPPSTLSYRVPNMYNPHHQFLSGNYLGGYTQMPPQNQYLAMTPVGLTQLDTSLPPPIDVETLSSETATSQTAESENSNAMKPGNYLVFAFDAYVWTDPETREQHLLQIGLNSLSEPGFLKWIIPTSFKNSTGCPMKIVRDCTYVCDLGPGRRVEVKDPVTLKEALSDMLNYLRKPKNPQLDGVVLLSYDPEAITSLLMSIVKFDDLKLRFVEIVKGLGNLKAYLELGPNENMAGEYTPQSIKSLYSAGVVVLGDLSDMDGYNCANNAKLITSILRRCFGNSDPPMNFIRRFFHPPKSILYRKAILNQNLNISVGKFVPLQKFVEESLLYYEKHLIPDGILFKLGTGSSESVAHRLSIGLVRAMVASFLEFDFLMETFLTKGHEGLEVELEQALMPNIIEKHMNKDSKEYKQLTKVVSLVVSFFHIHGHKSFSQMLDPKCLVPIKKLKVSPKSLANFDPMISEYLSFFGKYGTEKQTLSDEATALATNLASVGLTLDKMVELWEKESNFRKNLIGMIDDLMPSCNDSMKLCSFLISFLTRHSQKLSEANFESLGESFKLSKSKISMMDALIPKQHISPSAYERYSEDLKSLKPLEMMIEKELNPMIRVVVGTAEPAQHLSEHFIKMLAYTGNGLSVLRARHSRGRLSGAVFDCCNLHEDVVPTGFSAVVMTEFPF